jgi:hypothetical protein
MTNKVMMHKNKSYREKTPLLQKIALMIFGLFISLFLLETGLRVGGLILKSLQEHRNMKAIKQRGAYRIMCLGESTTAGVENSWPGKL